MARLTDAADYNAGEISGIVPSPRPESVNDHAYNGLRTTCVPLGLPANTNNKISVCFIDNPTKEYDMAKGMAFLKNSHLPCDPKGARDSLAEWLACQPPILHCRGSTPAEGVDKGDASCILATDMARHNDILNQFKTCLLDDLEAMQTISQETDRPLWASDKRLRDLVMCILIKVCDISNEARPLDVSCHWIDRLLEEFFTQVSLKL
ncbi:unnamed protein product [Protopolystoma xenopodis]|uniref:PDEase domain-containing protein n=1 Tax=Protopolystoma xenopodis TaxID=117903 RepID=A0A3S5AD18_9PLAT|nr:unnamed protein product [Protopolystoma xenopodis]